MDKGQEQERNRIYGNEERDVALAVIEREIGKQRLVVISDGEGKREKRERKKKREREMMPGLGLLADNVFVDRL